jgi:3-isopropylmalate/(R)-2-methylmalate dehydratase small subunit
MEKFTIHTGLVAPLDRENVDTDAIIPKQFLKSIKKTGFGPHLFDAWRYLDVGEPGMDLSKRRPNPDFVLNQPQYQGASIMLARKNFGCGSSREHAPGRCSRRLQGRHRAVLRRHLLQQLLQERVPADRAARLPGRSPLYRGRGPTRLQAHHRPSRANGNAAGEKPMHFDIDQSRKEALVNGWDETGLTLRHADEIKAYEEKRKKAEPWIFS